MHPRRPHRFLELAAGEHPGEHRVGSCHELEASIADLGEQLEERLEHVEERGELKPAEQHHTSKATNLLQPPPELRSPSRKPVERDGRRWKRLQEHGKYRIAEIRSVGHVTVQSHRSHPETSCHRANAERLDPVPARQLTTRRQDRRTIESQPHCTNIYPYTSGPAPSLSPRATPAQRHPGRQDPSDWRGAAQTRGAGSTGRADPSLRCSRWSA